LLANDALPGSCERSSNLGARYCARPYHMPCRTWWSCRHAAGEHARGHCRRTARGPLHRWRTWKGRHSGGRRQSLGGHGMKDFTPNIPEVVTEVRDLFERYESALETKAVAVLDATFWNSPHTVRYALHRTATASRPFTSIGWPARLAQASRSAVSASRF